MNIVELFSGSSNFSNEMRRRGHNVIDIDINKRTPAKYHLDISTLSFKDLENMFENNHIDFIFLAPDIFTYFNGIEEQVFINILNQANCGFIDEQMSLYKIQPYHKKYNISDVSYSIFDDISNRMSHLLTNCKDFDNYLNNALKNLTPVENDTMSNFLGGTPHQLILIIADYIEQIYQH